MDTKTIVKYVTYGASAIALVSLANVAPVQVVVLVVSAKGYSANSFSSLVRSSLLLASLIRFLIPETLVSLAAVDS